MNKIFYYANLTLLPLFFIVCLVKNSFKLLNQAVRWTVSETKNSYNSNRRYYKMD